MRRYGTRSKEEEAETKTSPKHRSASLGRRSTRTNPGDDEEEEKVTSPRRTSLGKRKTVEHIKNGSEVKKTKTAKKDDSDDEEDHNRATRQTRGQAKQEGLVNGRTPTRSMRSAKDQESTKQDDAKNSVKLKPKSSTGNKDVKSKEQFKEKNDKNIDKKTDTVKDHGEETVKKNETGKKKSDDVKCKSSGSASVSQTRSTRSHIADNKSPPSTTLSRQVSITKSNQAKMDTAAKSSSEDSSSIEMISDGEEADDDESDEDAVAMDNFNALSGDNENSDESSVQEVIYDSDSEIVFTPRKSSPDETLEAAIIVLQQDYEKKLREKDEQIQRLKHDLSWKEEQLTEMGDLAAKNLDLESRLTQILSDTKCYEEEVKKQKESKAEENKKDCSDNEKATSSKKETAEKEVAKKEVAKKDVSKKEVESKKDKADKEKRKKETTKENKSSDDTVTPKRKRRNDKEEENSEKTDGKRRRSKRGKKKEDEEEEEEEGEDIDALFVSDDEDDDVIEIPIPEKKDEPKTLTEKQETKDTPPKKLEKTKEDKEKAEDEDGGGDDDDDDDDDDKHKGRKQIRKLMTTKKLAEETVQAAKEEKDRRQRVKKLKEMHIRVDEKATKNKAPVTTKLVLATKNNDMKTPLVQVNNKLIKKLKPHQVDAVEFMWDSVIESMENFKEVNDDGNGCIIAHCMGLGKTLSVITFVHTLMTHKCIGFKTCLVVAPLNAVLNWKTELNKWLDKKDRLKVYELASCKDNHQRADQLQEWRKGGGIMIMGYQIFRILATSTTRSKKKKQIFLQSLQDPGPDIVVCDEGHMLKNDMSLVAKCMNQVKTKRRLVLTGTPLQNNLTEYHCMVNFVKPNLLGTRREFSNRFVNPITNGQHADSTQYDVRLMKRRAHVLHEMLAGCVQRKDYSALVKFLPPKEEYVISVRLSPLQMDLYKKYLDGLRDESNPNDPSKALVGARLFSDYQQLMRIWTHPWVLRMNEIREEKRAQYDEDEDDEFASLLDSESEDDTTTSAASSDDEDGKKNDKKSTSNTSKKESEVKDTKDEKSGNKTTTENNVDISDDDSDVVEITPRRSGRASRGLKNDESKNPPEVNGHAKKADNKKKEPEKSNKSKSEKDKGKSSTKENDKLKDKPEENPDPKARKSKIIAGEVIKQWKSSFRRKDGDSDDELAKKKEEAWWASMLDEEQHMKNLELSGKLILMFEILRMAQTFGDKVLVFSQSLLSLDLIEDFLRYKNEEFEESKSKKGPKKKTLSSWLKDEDYVRMDGSTAANNRKRLTEDFNDSKNSRLRLFLISTRAGGLGINLDTANRVIIFDASWNPSHDIQSIFRVYRFGQEKPVYVYRFLAQGTMEDKIYERQVTKETLSQRVIDENQIDRHFTASDLQALYNFTPARLDDPEENNRPTPKLPKDLILTELLSNHKDWIVGYHEHDSLLERRPEEDLSEEERKKAWEEYERDKQGLYASYRMPPITQNPIYSHTNIFGNRPLPNNVQFPTMFRPIQPTPPINLLGPSNNFEPEFNMPNLNQLGIPQHLARGSLGFQISQLPRVVQEILKYNPNISPMELQNRLQAFLGMHARYTVPGFAMGSDTSESKKVAPKICIKFVKQSMAANASAVQLGPTPSTSLQPNSANVLPQMLPTLIGNPQVIPQTMPYILPQLGQVTLPPTILASTSQPSRLPLPGKLPAYSK